MHQLCHTTCSHYVCVGLTGDWIGLYFKSLLENGVTSVHLNLDQCYTTPNQNLWQLECQSAVMETHHSTPKPTKVWQYYTGFSSLSLSLSVPPHVCVSECHRLYAWQLGRWLVCKRPFFVKFHTVCTRTVSLWRKSTYYIMQQLLGSLFTTLNIPSLQMYKIWADKILKGVEHTIHHFQWRKDFNRLIDKEVFQS